MFFGPLFQGNLHHRDLLARYAKNAAKNTLNRLGFHFSREPKIFQKTRKKTKFFKNKSPSKSDPPQKSPKSWITEAFRGSKTAETAKF